MSKTWLRLIGLLTIYTLLLSFLQTTQCSIRDFLPQLMPPSPILEERIEKGLIDEPAVLAEGNALLTQGIDNPQMTVKRTGTIRALAVVVDFNDKVRTVQASYFDTLIFAAPVIGRGSVKDFFDEVSYSQVDIVTLNLPSNLGWVRAPSSYSNYVNGGYCINTSYPQNCQKLAEDIVAAIDSSVNFSEYDNDHDGWAEPIMLIHAGPGAEYTGSPNDIWSHSWNLRTPSFRDGVYISKYVIMPEYWTSVNASSSDMTIGVFAHEMGHGFWGLPDLYDTTNRSEGIGNWSLMASGSWNGPYNNGSSPAWPDAWSRIQMGFVTPTQIIANTTSSSFPKIVGETGLASVFKIQNSKLQANEYFLIENRQRTSGSYDQYLPGSGLLVWQIDEAMWNFGNDYRCLSASNSDCDDSYHYLVALKQADGVRNLEYKKNRGDTGDPFPGSSNRTSWTINSTPDTRSYYNANDSCIQVTNISPAADTMTAALQVTCQSPPTNVNAIRTSATQITLNWVDVEGETSYLIDRSIDGGENWLLLATTSANTVNFTDANAPEGTIYRYRVQAVNADGGSFYSSVAESITLAFRAFLPAISK